jgi:RecB family endonuclease NucS
LISTDKRDEILALLREGKATNTEIAKSTGVPLRSVGAIEANLTRGAYDGATALQSEEASDALEATFGLERDLQVALRNNIEQLKENLTVADGGKEHSVPSGRIDILAKDAKGAAVVIELKAGTADRDAVGQILSYLGDIRSESKKPVRGILIAGDFTARAISAAKAVGNIKLMKYAFKFSFHKADQG